MKILEKSVNNQNKEKKIVIQLKKKDKINLLRKNLKIRKKS